MRVKGCGVTAALLVLALVCGQADAVSAQEGASTAPPVAAAATEAGVRFTAAGASVVASRLEVFSESGERVFDTGERAGGVLDWRLAGGGAGESAPADGTYLCVVTVRTLAGHVRQRRGTLELKAGRAGAAGAGPNEAQLRAWGESRTAQSLAPLPEGGLAPSLAFMPESGARAITLATHDGQAGSVTSTSGALTLRTGDLLGGAEKEHVRITPDGRVGVGTTDPQATLDVAGTIRARALLLDKTGGGGASAVDDPQPLVDGTGTTNKVTKWANGPAGTLGDSSITEVGGRVGIGTNAPSYALVVGPDIMPGFVAAVVTVSKGAGQSVSLYAGPSGTQGLEFGWDANNGRGFVNAPGSPIAFTHHGVEKMRLHTNGFLGVGTAAPTAPLDVSGVVNTTARYTIAGINALSIPAGLNNLFAGNGDRATLTTGAGNSFFGHNSGGNITSGNFNSLVGHNSGRLITSGSDNTFTGAFAGENTTSGGENAAYGYEAGQLNQTGARNSFFGHGAGRANTAGNDNSFFGHGAGAKNTASGNSFFGRSAGANNAHGASNSFFGFEAGLSNTGGTGNTFVGNISGHANTAGHSNTFIGSQAGRSNTTAVGNTFVGDSAGRSTTTAHRNSFLGTFAGSGNSTGEDNTFVGSTSGSSNSTGSDNTFVGSDSGGSNQTGGENTFVGKGAGSGGPANVANTALGFAAETAAGADNATAIGARAYAAQNSSVILGSVAGINGATATARVGIGTTTPESRLHVQGGNVYIGTNGTGVILKSPDGTKCRQLTIDNAGALIVSATPCP